MEDQNLDEQKLREWIGRSYGSYEKWQKAREGNQDIDARMERHDDRESWVCMECKELIVGDVNSNRAKIRAINNAVVFVKFGEMAAYCKCGAFNQLVFSSDYNDAVEADFEGRERDTFFSEDRERYQRNKKPGDKERDIAPDYYLKLK